MSQIGMTSRQFVNRAVVLLAVNVVVQSFILNPTASATAPSIVNTDGVVITASSGVYSVTFKLGALSCISSSCAWMSGAHQVGDSATSVEWRYRIGETGAWTSVSKDCLATPIDATSTWCNGTLAYSTLSVVDIKAGDEVFAQAALRNDDGQSEWLNPSATPGVPASAIAGKDTVTARIWMGNSTSNNRRGNAGMTGDSFEFKSSTMSVAASGVIAKYEWDLDGDSTYEVSTSTNDIHTKKWTDPGTYTVRLRLTSQGGETGTQEQKVEIFKLPPVGETGISLNSGSAYTNSKSIKIGLIWPEYATSARISNDGGFAASKTLTLPLNAVVDWDLDDSVKGLYTKVVYVRFNGDISAFSQTYSDDIILDTTAPTIESSSAKLSSANLEVNIKATDDVTGVDKVELASDKASTVKAYASSLSVPASEVGLGVASAGVHQFAARVLRVRVSDVAGNWTEWKTLGSFASAAHSTRALRVSKTVSGRIVAGYASLSIPSGATVSMKVTSGSTKVCRVVGSSLKGLRSGGCRVTVSVRPRNGTAKSKTVTISIT